MPVQPHAPTRPRVEPALRHPEPGDHVQIVGLVDEWWAGRRVHDALPRLWFEHFARTSWIAEADGGLVGFLVGFRSPDHPEVGRVHMAATTPNLRRRGIGTALYARFGAQMRGLGVARLEAAVWPGDRTALAFHRALGFSIDAGPGTVNRYGMPAYADLDCPDEDRTRFFLDL
jgi:GNAT superfamily N-acetyltransferase